MSDYTSAQIVEKTSSISEYRIVIYTGLAMFAMFFGAGNIVFPLYLGANCGENIIWTLLGFLLAGVGVPFLGLIAVSHYNGDYFAFFARLGKIPALMVISLLMIVLGPLGAMPRTETTTFNTLLPYLPNFLQNNTIFSIFYCGLVFLLAYREAKIIKILGFFLSPVKIISFSSLVIIGLNFTETPLVNGTTMSGAFKQAVSFGYNTMDLLAGIFFCNIAFDTIKMATKNNPKLKPSLLTLKSCVFGIMLISIVYTGFMLLAYYHGPTLQGLKAEQTITAISQAVLGKFGGLFVCVAVSFACLATTLALGQACSHCLYKYIFQTKLSKRICFAIMIVATYLMSNLGFQGILEISLPLVNIIYPALIVLCALTIIQKWIDVKSIKLPVFITLIISSVSYIF